jgi:cytochrome b subunit of formate dehydrogenase
MNGVIILLVGIVAVSLNVNAAELIKNSDCMDCHNDKELTKTNANGQVKSLFVDESVLKASVHKTNYCVNCHIDITKKHPDDGVAAKPVNCALCHERLAVSYTNSIHGILKARGEEAAPSCVDCHGSHNILPPTNPKSPLYYSNLIKTCGECHPEAAKDVAVSVHGKSAQKGYREAAVCTDCHSEHKIEKLKDASPRVISEIVCAKCHASEKINTKFGIPADRVKTFLESYHGLASHKGETKAANCASCHGYHKILPSTDPESSIHKNNLVATCGKCHPGATEKFASGKIHADYGYRDTTGEKVNYWVRKIYLYLIVITIGSFFVHNFLVWLRKALFTLKDPTRTIERMSTAFRIQHFVLIVTFIYLALSGFALRFPESWLSALLLNNEGFRKISHRIAGVALIVCGLWHIIYVIATKEGRQLFFDMLPRVKDFKDVIQQIKYIFNLDKKPVFGRFGYIEKIEYWAVVWGTIIMGLTGFIIWFKVGVTQFLPRWIVEVAITIHYYEAILACLAIVIWHFYHVIFDPDVYPMNWAWLDGKINQKLYKERHGGDSHNNSDKSTSSGKDQTKK